MEPPLASASPSGSVTSSPTASSASLSRLRAAFWLRSVLRALQLGQSHIPFTAEVLIDDLASGAGLAAGVPLVGFYQHGAIPVGLVPDLVQQAGHSSVGERLGLQPSLNHARHVEGLNAQGVVLSDQGKADVMVRVVAQAGYPAVGLVQAALGFPPSPAARCASRLGLLPAAEFA